MKRELNQESKIFLNKRLLYIITAQYGVVLLFCVLCFRQCAEIVGVTRAVGDVLVIAIWVVASSCMLEYSENYMPVKPHSPKDRLRGVLTLLILIVPIIMCCLSLFPMRNDARVLFVAMWLCGMYHVSLLVPVAVYLSTAIEKIANTLS